MKIQTFYYEKETEISFVLPKNKQHNSYHNKATKWTNSTKSMLTATQGFSGIGKGCNKLA